MVNEDGIDKDIQQCFNESTSKKNLSGLRGRASRTGRKGAVVTPVDFLKGKEKKAYMGNSKVLRYNLHEGGLGNLDDYTEVIPWDEVKNWTKEKQMSAILIWRDTYATEVLVRGLGVTEHQYRYKILPHLGVKPGMRKREDFSYSSTVEATAYSILYFMSRKSEWQGTTSQLLLDLGSTHAIGKNSFWFPTSSSALLRRLKKSSLLLEDLGCIFISPLSPDSVVLINKSIDFKRVFKLHSPNVIHEANKEGKKSQKYRSKKLKYKGLAQVIAGFMEDKTTWRGNSQDLMTELNKLNPSSDNGTMPKKPSALTRVLNNIKDLLPGFGVQYRNVKSATSTSIIFFSKTTEIGEGDESSMTEEIKDDYTPKHEEVLPVPVEDKKVSTNEGLYLSLRGQYTNKELVSRLSKLVEIVLASEGKFEIDLNILEVPE